MAKSGAHGQPYTSTFKIRSIFLRGLRGFTGPKIIMPFFYTERKKKVHTRERCAELERQDWGAKAPPPSSKCVGGRLAQKHHAFFYTLNEKKSAST